MTERLFYANAYETRFSARVTEELTWDDKPAVILDRTAFYPASGGQPADRGQLENAAVVDVVERETDGAIVHVLSAPIADQEVRGEVAWQRRFDHMQQHSGQHILSAACERLLDGDTVGFHLGTESSTIDLNVANLAMDDLLPCETLANEVVWDDRTVVTRVLASDRHQDEAVKPPPGVDAPLRLVEIAGGSGATESPFDVNPCGGTHVDRTGEIGMIKITGVEHRGDETRVTFLCGGRALRNYETTRRITSNLVNILTVGTWELDEAVQRLQEENKELRRSERALRQRLLDAESAEMLREARALGSCRVAAAVWEGRSPNELQILARKLAEHGNVVALLFSVGERVFFCFARGEDVDLDVRNLVEETCMRMDGNGGGRPQVAQGSAPVAGVQRIRSVLHDLEAMLKQEMEAGSMS